MAEQKWIQRPVGKIAILLLVVAVVFGIWLYKNQSDALKRQASTGSSSQDGMDYALAVTALTMDDWLSSGAPLVIDFGATECIPCKAMAPVLETLNAEWQGRALVKFLDVWKYGDQIGDFPVSTIPTQFVFDRDGKPYVPSEDIGIPFTLYSSPDTGEHIYTAHIGGITEEELRRVMKELGVE